MKDDERVLELEFLRATENAALHSSHWMGRGDKEAADYAACDAIRGMFDLMDIRGEIVIGEGIKDEAVVAYCEPLITKEMVYHQLSRRVNKMGLY